MKKILILFLCLFSANSFAELMRVTASGYNPTYVYKCFGVTRGDILDPNGVNCVVGTQYESTPYKFTIIGSSIGASRLAVEIRRSDNRTFTGYANLSSAGDSCPEGQDLIDGICREPPPPDEPDCMSGYHYDASSGLCEPDGDGSGDGGDGSGGDTSDSDGGGDGGGDNSQTCAPGYEWDSIFAECAIASNYCNVKKSDAISSCQSRNSAFDQSKWSCNIETGDYSASCIVPPDPDPDPDPTDPDPTDPDPTDPDPIDPDDGGEQDPTAPLDPDGEQTDSPDYTSKLNDLDNSVKSLAGNIDGVKSAVDTGVQTLKKSIDDSASSVVSAVDSNATKISNAVDNNASAISSAVDSNATKISNAVNNNGDSIVKAVGDGAGDIVDAVNDGNTILGDINDGVNDLGDGINGVKDLLTNTPALTSGEYEWSNEYMVNLQETAIDTYDAKRKEYEDLILELPSITGTGNFVGGSYNGLSFNVSGQSVSFDMFDKLGSNVSYIRQAILFIASIFAGLIILSAATRSKGF